MDDLDLTEERMSAELERRIAAARRNVPHQDGPEHCEECDETIPLPRRQLGYALCVPCAAAAERHRQIYAGAAK